MIHTEHYTIRSGDLLIAPPDCADPRFKRSVIMMTHDNDSGTYGLCLNKPTEHLLSSILEPLHIYMEWDQPMYWGGPMHSQTVWMLHDPTWHIAQTVGVDANWSMTSHSKMFDVMTQGMTPLRQRIVFGYSHWGPGQLLGELKGEAPWRPSHSWLILNNPDPDWIMDIDPEDLWTQGVQQCGVQAVDHWLS